MPQLLYAWEGHPIPIVEEAVWALWPGWMAGELPPSTHPPQGFNPQIIQLIVRCCIAYAIPALTCVQVVPNSDIDQDSNYLD
jgi:hypothetical protein